MKVTDVLPTVSEVNDSKGYKMFNDGSTEVEVGEFLQAMVRLVKPTWILETGTYKGISSSYMGLGLKENNSGTLETLEIDVNCIEESKKLWAQVGVEDKIVSYNGSSLDFVPKQNYQMIFLDTEPGIRFAELVRFFPYLDEGGFIGIHDLPRGFCQGNINPDHPEFESWPYGPVPEQIKIWLKTGELIKFHFPNPREMTWFYKQRKDDYHV